MGGIIACVSMPLIDKIHIDDPVGASSVHGNVCLYIDTWGNNESQLSWLDEFYRSQS